MALMKSTLSIGLLLIVCLYYSAAQTTSKPGLTPANTAQSQHVPTPKQKGTPHPEAFVVKTHERFVAFFSDEGFSSELLLQNNRLDSPVTANPALILNRSEVPLEPVVLPPHGAATVDINAALQMRGLSPTRGVLVIRYDFSTYAALSAVVTAADSKHDVYLNFSAQSAEEFWSGNSFDAVVWAPDDNTEGFVSIINTYSDPTVVRAVFSSSSHVQEERSIVIAPHQQNLLRIDSLVKRSARTGTPAGIHLEFTGDPGQIVAEGALLNKRTGFSKHIQFTNTALHFATSARRTHFLLLGRQPVEDGFPAQVSFQSIAALRNVDSAPVKVIPTVKYLNNGSLQKITLPAVNLEVNESRLIDFAEEQRSGHLPAGFVQGSLELAPNTDHTSIVSELFNFDAATHSYVVGPSFGAHPMRSTMSIWRTDGSFQTTVAIENTANLNDQVTVDLFSDQGTYEKVIDVPAGALVKLNIKDLQQKGIRDKNGKLLLGTNGTLHLSGSRGGRSALAYDKLIHSADDSEYVGLPAQPCDYVQDFSPFLDGDVNAFSPFITEYWTDGSDDTFEASPTSENSNLVQVTTDNAGNPIVIIDHSPDGVSHSVGLDFFDTVLDCTACSTREQEHTLFVTVPVPVPTYFYATGADPLLSADCALNQAGAGFTVHYQVLDQLGNFLQVGGMTPLETAPGANNSPFATPRTTNPDGTFEDTPLGTCFGPPVPSTNVCVNDQQTFHIIYTNGVTYPITTVSTSRHCVKGISLTVSGNPGGTENFSIGTVN